MMDSRVTLRKEPLVEPLCSSPFQASQVHTSAFMRVSRLPGGAARPPAITPECSPKGVHE